MNEKYYQSMQGDNNFKRLRVGISHPGKGKDMTTYVLKASKGQKPIRENF